MAFKLVALHLPSQEEVTYGPWPSGADAQANTIAVTFAQGFICGIHSMTHPEETAAELAFTVVVVDDEPEPPTNIVGVLKAEASMTVTHPDGTTS
jgi:hypothetical protein